jgi:hypothetical protein
MILKMILEGHRYPGAELFDRATSTGRLAAMERRLKAIAAGDRDNAAETGEILSITERSITHLDTGAA